MKKSKSRIAPAGRRSKKKPGAQGPVRKGVSLPMRIGKGFDRITEVVNFDVMNLSDKVALKRIQDIHVGIIPGRLKETDWINMKRIAAKYGVML